MPEGGRGGGVGGVVGRHVDRLHGGDGPLARRGDAFLELPHFRGQRGLVADGRGHAAQQGGHFAAGLRKTEDVVDEQEDVGAGRVAEVFGYGQGRQGDAQAGPGGLVHLAEDHAGLREDVAAGIADLGLLHFQPEVVALAGPLADAGEDGIAAVGAGDARDQLGQDDGLAQAGPAEQPGLAAADEGRQEVDHLDAGLEDFRLRRQVGHRRRLAVDGPMVLGLDGAAAVDGLAHQVEDAAERGLAHRHLDRSTGVDAVHAADHAVGVSQGDAADATAAEVLLHFAGEVQVDAFFPGRHLHGVVDRRHVTFRELGVEGGADDLGDLADVDVRFRGGSGGGHGYSLVVCCFGRPEGDSPIFVERKLGQSPGYSLRASAPPMISSNSEVICPCRARL